MTVAPSSKPRGQNYNLGDARHQPGARNQHWSSSTSSRRYKRVTRSASPLSRAAASACSLASSRPPSQGKIATPEIRRAKNSGPRLLDRGGQHIAVVWFSNQGKAFFHRLEGGLAVPGYQQNREFWTVSSQRSC